jgi:hypothetical protein
VVVADEEHAETETGGQDHADGRVAFRGALAQQADQGGHDQRADERAGERVVGDEQSRHRAGEGELARAVDRERHRPRDDEGADQAAAHRHEEGRLERVLGEGELEIEADAHQCAWSWSWCAWAPGSVGSSSSALTTR